MSISPKSERVALLWGDRWWIEGPAEPIVFGELARAAETLLAAFGDSRPARLRLVYQPDFLAADSIDCPRGNRATLQAAFGEQFSALFSEDRAWGFEPIVGAMNVFSTVLYHEAQPGLYPLVQALEDAGIEVVGAWPLSTVLNFVPDDWPDTGALVVVAVAQERALVFQHSPDGKRDVRAVVGAEVPAFALETIRAALSRPELALQVAPLDAGGEALLQQLPAADVPRLRLAVWARLTAAARTLSCRWPNQLLPVAPWFNPGRSLLVASVASLLAAVGLAGDYLWSKRTQQREQLAHAAVIAGLRSELQQRRAEASRADARPEPVNTVAASALLRAVAAAPDALVLTELSASPQGVEVRGGALREVVDAEWQRWLETLRHSQPHLDVPPVARPTGAFSIVAKLRS